MKQILLLAGLITVLSLLSFKPKRIKHSDAANYIGKTVEVLGKAYYAKSITNDFSIIYIGYDLNSPKLIMYYKFRYSTTFASMTNKEFGHFIGKIKIIAGKPVLIITKLKNAIFYSPFDERADSALYYHKLGML